MNRHRDEDDGIDWRLVGDMLAIAFGLTVIAMFVAVLYPVFIR